MKYLKSGDKYFFRVEKGQDLVKAIFDFVSEKKIKSGSVSGIGASNDLEIGLFNTKEKKYYSREFKKDFEICSLSGNVTWMKGEPYLHLHAVVADEEQRVLGGHLNRAVISATFEGVIVDFGKDVDREVDEEIGLNLLKF